MSTPSASSNADEPPQQENHQLASLSSLPHEIVLSCLARVPRSCHLNLAHVSKTLRSLIRSRELRSLIHKKNSLYVYLHNPKNKTYHWLTLLQCEETMISYRLAPIPFPCHPFMRHSSAVAVGSEIYYVGGSSEPSSDLWILDTLSGKFHQGPSMKVPRRGVDTWLGVIDGKIYVIGGGCDEKNHVEVFDPETEIWKLLEKEKVVPPRFGCKQYIASLEHKVYMVETGGISVYNPREGRGKRMVGMVSDRLGVAGSNKARKRLSVRVNCVCVVENVLYACFIWHGLMWFDTKLNVWRELVSRDGKELTFKYVHAMTEYEGKLAAFRYLNYGHMSDNTKSVKMFLFALDRVKDRVCGTIEWSGVVAKIPNSSDFLHCLNVSD